MGTFRNILKTTAIQYLLYIHQTIIYKFGKAVGRDSPLVFTVVVLGDHFRQSGRVDFELSGDGGKLSFCLVASQDLPYYGSKLFEGGELILIFYEVIC